MVNMYVLADGTLPSPWALVTTWDGRYLRCASSVGQHGSVGGAIQHRHLTKATTSGSCSGLKPHWGYGATFVHSHSIPAVYTGYSNNDPLYRTLSLWRIDYSVWESTWRSFPKNAIVLSYSSISAAGLGRWSAGDGRLVLLGTPGSNGGRSTHTDHTLTATLSPGGAGGQGGDPAGGGASNETHSHTFSATEVPSNSLMPARVMTRFYVATDTTDRAPAGVVCFFDSAPSANWALVSEWAGRFPMSFDSDPVTEGLDSHGHSAVSGSSSNHRTNNGAQTYFAGSATMANRTHNHTVSIEADQADHLPEYVSLCPYYLNTTLLHINSETETWTMDSVLKAVKTTSATMGLRSQGAGSAIMTPDVLVQDTFDNGWYMDMIGHLKDQELTWDTNAQAMIQPCEYWSMAVSLLFSHVTWDSNLRLIRPVTANPPVIDTIVKAWADEFNYLHQLITSMEWANKLASATGTELDDKWGSIFEIPRWTGETDDAYRKRLQTYTMIHTSSGTKSNAEAVLDTIVEEAGASSIETCWPATVRVNFSTDSALRMATTYQSLIEYTLGQLIASGISWTMYLPYIDYSMGATFSGQTFIEYELDLLAKQEDKDFSYWLRPRLVNRLIEGWDMDALISLVDLERSWEERVALKTVLDYWFGMDALVQDTLSTSWTMGNRALRAYTKTFYLGARVMSYDLERSVVMDILAKRVLRRTYRALTTLILQLTASAIMDAWLKKFNITKSYVSDLVVWVCEPEQYGMTIGLVPA